MEGRTDRESLGTEILREVSRTFYLSIRILPAPVREPIALAYLLARSTDTIADTPAVANSTKLALLKRFKAGIDGTVDPDLLADLKEQFCPLQTHEGERVLLERTDGCLSWLDAMGASDRSHVRRVLGHIVRGQQMDIERFDRAERIVALKSACELDEYTYLVAGSVGEFWTDVCQEKLGSRFCTAGGEEMQRLGVEYGQGLQLLNILRDLRSDMREGRCYLPVPDGKVDEPTSVMESFRDWLEICGKKLEAGVNYAAQVKDPRVRLATALPCFLAVKTWNLLGKCQWEDLEGKVKVSRWELKKTVLRGTVAALMGGEGVREYYEKLRKGD